MFETLTFKTYDNNFITALLQKHRENPLNSAWGHEIMYSTSYWLVIIETNEVDSLFLPLRIPTKLAMIMSSYREELR